MGNIQMWFCHFLRSSYCENVIEGDWSETLSSNVNRFICFNFLFFKMVIGDLATTKKNVQEHSRPLASVPLKPSQVV